MKVCKRLRTGKTGSSRSRAAVAVEAVCVHALVHILPRTVTLRCGLSFLNPKRCKIRTHAGLLCIRSVLFLTAKKFFSRENQKFGSLAGSLQQFTTDLQKLLPAEYTPRKSLSVANVWTLG